MSASSAIVMTTISSFSTSFHLQVGRIGSGLPVADWKYRTGELFLSRRFCRRM